MKQNSSILRWCYHQKEHSIPGEFMDGSIFLEIWVVCKVLYVFVWSSCFFRFQSIVICLKSSKDFSWPKLVIQLYSRNQLNKVRNLLFQRKMIKSTQQLLRKIGSFNLAHVTISCCTFQACLAAFGVDVGPSGRRFKKCLTMVRRNLRIILILSRS